MSEELNPKNEQLISDEQYDDLTAEYRSKASNLTPSQLPNRNLNLDGVDVPRLQGINASDGSLIIILAEQYTVNISQEDALDFVWYIANAIVIGMGYTGWDEYAAMVKNPPTVVVN